ncbi:peptidoglycan DD-metalloendopeptidase family protein [Paenarthrobacter sp. Z7-10]|nr:peptidoglycan DD-metalloendopeptidase family protein [Paenarthrobacter sp. Z7-10]
MRPSWHGRAAVIKSRRRVLSASIVAVLLAGLLASVPAHADNLDDRAKALQAQADDVESSLEFVDASLAKAAANLTLYRGRLPGAQQSLSDAQARVTTATAEVDGLAARVDLAQQNKDEITAQIGADARKLADTKKVIGQIAAQSYKSGGVPSNLSLILGSSSSGSLANTMNMADQALRSQNAALDKLSQQQATNVNVQARLEAVEAEIKDLKGQADAALAGEQAARDEAAAKKAAVDKLIADAAALDAELTAKKPQIQAKMAAVKAQQENIANQIAERQRKEREAAAAAARAAAAALGNHNYISPPAGSPSAFGLRHPFAAGIAITSGFGLRQTPPGTIDFNGSGSYLHSGIDFGAACGTPVYAPAAGTVTLAGWTNLGGGFSVWISHGVVQGNALMTVYYHNSKVMVSQGQHVNTGDLIAYTGNTGNSTGCHAHFETWLNGKPVDPMTVLGS